MVSWSVGRGGGAQRPRSCPVADGLHGVGKERLGRLAELLLTQVGAGWWTDTVVFELLLGWLGAA